MQTMPAQSVITYDGLPVSRGGAHTLKTKDPLTALRQVLNFIQACAVATVPMDAHVELVSGPRIPDAFFKPLHERFVRAYGIEKLQGLGDDTGHRWAIPLSEAEQLAQLLASLRPLPLHPYGLQPASVHLDLKFHFRSSAGKEELPGQGADSYMNFVPGFGQILGESEIFARLSEKSTLSVFFNFPFAEASPDFLAFREFVQAHLPFKMSAHHWKRWSLTRKGDKYVGRKF